MIHDELRAVKDGYGSDDEVDRSTHGGGVIRHMDGSYNDDNNNSNNNVTIKQEHAARMMHSTDTSPDRKPTAHYGAEASFEAVKHEFTGNTATTSNNTSWPREGMLNQEFEHPRTGSGVANDGSIPVRPTSGHVFRNANYTSNPAMLSAVAKLEDTGVSGGPPAHSPAHHAAVFGMLNTPLSPTPVPIVATAMPANVAIATAMQQVVPSQQIAPPPRTGELPADTFSMPPRYE